MIRVLINVWYPVEKNDDVGKKYLEVEKVFPFPPVIKPAVAWETWATNSGLKGSGIFETKPEHFEETINYFVRRLTMYADAIEGYRFEIAAAVTSERGRKLIGKDLSEFLLPEK
ncbi:MAG: hypothetical protein KGD58_10305 [Candidatus Lokiarchaeota archaeon]|nr:hypothetical protein [Candidatus Lokiarchaeota archaeon]